MNILVDFKEWYSKSELISHLTNNVTSTLILGMEAEAPTKYYSLQLKRTGGEIGIISSGLGTKPSAIFDIKSNMIIVGYDLMVVGINLDSYTVMFKKALNGVFYEFILIDNEQSIIVIHELGAIRLRLTGETDWSVDTDIVYNFLIDDVGNLKINTLYELTEFIINVKTGQITNT